jgi:release factor glutamine methyltransferase
MSHLQKEVTFEPELALYGGEDGLDFYRRLAREVPQKLTIVGALFLEIGFSQASAVLELFPRAQVFNDLSGNARVVVWIK